jgi:hypothetical protein
VFEYLWKHSDSTHKWALFCFVTIPHPSGKGKGKNECVI